MKSIHRDVFTINTHSNTWTCIGRRNLYKKSDFLFPSVIEKTDTFHSLHLNCLSFHESNIYRSFDNHVKLKDNPKYIIINEHCNFFSEQNGFFAEASLEDAEYIHFSKLSGMSKFCLKTKNNMVLEKHFFKVFRNSNPLNIVFNSDFYERMFKLFLSEDEHLYTIYEDTFRFIPENKIIFFLSLKDRSIGYLCALIEKAKKEKNTGILNFLKSNFLLDYIFKGQIKSIEFSETKKDLTLNKSWKI